MLTYVIELHCDTPGCTYPPIVVGPTSQSHQAALVWEPTQRAKLAGWEQRGPRHFCPDCRKIATGSERTKE